MSTAESEQIVHFVREYSKSNSDALLDPSCKFFSLPDIEGMIGYRFEAGCAIVYGDPACAPEHRQSLVEAFHTFCEEQDKEVVYMVASSEFKQWALQGHCQAAVEFGAEYYLDPTDDPRKGSKGSLARRKVRRAEKEGVKVHEYTGNDPELEDQILAVGQRWLEGREGPQLHISNVHLFEHRTGKRWFYATQNGRVVGVVVLNELRSQKGWLLNHLMLAPDAPGGTPEILVVTAVDQVASEGCRYVTFGGVPAQEVGEIGGFGAITTWLVPKLYYVSKKVFKLEGRHTFWKKFQPKRESSYVLFRKPRLGIKELLGLMRAVNLRF